MPRRRTDLPTFEQVRNELNNASFRDDGARAANQGQLTTHFGRAFTERFARDPFAEDRELDQANATQANRYLVERINIGNYNGAINRLAGDDVGRKYGALVRYGTQLEIEAARKRDQIRQQLLNDEIPGVSNLYEGIDDDLLDKLTNNIYVIRYRDEALHLDAYHRAKESFVAQMPVSNHTYKTTVMNDGNPEETIVTRPFTTYLADIEEKTVDQVYSLPANEDIAEKRQFISGGQRYQPDTTAAPAFGYVINRNPLADNPFTAVPAEHRALAQAVGTPNASETMASQKNRYIHQLAQCEYYKQSASDIAARAGEMLAELDSIEKPEDHTNNPSYNAFRESLRRLRDSCNEGVDPQKMIDNMILVNRFAKHYEDSHTGLFSFSAYNDYGKKRLALSQRAQTFAAVNIAKLNPQYYGLSRKPIDHQIQRYRNDIERIDRTAAKLNIQGIPNSYSFRSHDLSRMGEMNRRLHNAQRGVWNGSPQYDTYAQEMVGLTSNYIMCRNTLDDPNASAQNKREAIESIRDSIQRVRTAGNAYIQRKNEQGLIQNGACGSVKTQKRVTTVLDGMRFLDVLNEHLDDELMAIDSPDAANIRFN
ncbi:MAG: hypothetical protein IJ129_04290, partial [Ruminococcus sp.]|nr:hypothetical protein [Ruminococcus sp.]